MDAGGSVPGAQCHPVHLDLGIWGRLESRSGGTGPREPSLQESGPVPKAVGAPAGM